MVNMDNYEYKSREMSMTQTVFHKNRIKTIMLSMILGMFVMVLSGWTVDVYAASRVPRMSKRRFGRELAKMVDEHDGHVSRTKAERDPFLSARLIVRSSDPLLDPSEYGATDAVQDSEGHYVLQFASSAEAREAWKKLKKKKTIKYAEPDRYLFAAADEFEREDSQTVSSWGVSSTGCDKFSWYANKEKKSDSVTVAVVDSGIMKNHELFTGRLASAGEYDYYDRDEDASDEYGHGTQVAGVIAMCTSGISSIRILPVRILSPTGATSFSKCAAAISELSGNVDIINLSVVSSRANSTLGTDDLRNGEYLKETIKGAVQNGTVVVVAAGNADGDTAEYSPADITDEQADGCIVVTASNKNGIPHQNYGESVDLSAPGAGIVSACMSNGSVRRYCTKSGTSYAAPHVSAAAAMLKLCNPGLSPSQIETILEENTVAYPNVPDHNYGRGILNLINLIPEEYLIEYEIQKEKAAAEAVMELISDLPSSVTLADKAAIMYVREAYEALTDAQKVYVLNLNALISAESAIVKLEEDKAAAQPVIDQIGALPSSDVLTIDDKATVEAARAAYDSLSDDQKAMVDNAGRLSAAETRLKELIRAAEENSQNKYPRSDPQPNVTYRVPLKKKQKTRALKVTGLADGDKVVSWSSSNKKKAIVTGQEDGTCVIKAGKKTGNVRIIAVTASGKNVIFKLRVQSGKVKTKKIRIEKRTVRIAVGETFILQPVLYPVTSVQKIFCKSGDKSVARVTKKGVIRAISAGMTKIIITSGNAKLKVKVIVN